MTAPAYNLYSSARRPVTNWQSANAASAQALWDQQAPQVYGAADTAAAGQAGAVAGSGSALSRLGQFQPSALQGYQPTALQQYSPSALQGYNPSSYLTGPSGSASAAAKANAGIAPALVAATDWSKASGAAGALEGFDPSAAGTTYAQGAVGTFNQDLSTQLAELERKSAGTGRLETGFYTGDQGTVATNLGKDFNSKLQEAALTFSGQRLSALQGGATAYTNIAADQSSAAQAMANEQDYARLTGQGQQIGALTAEEQMAVGEQEQASAQGLSRAGQIDSMGLSRAEQLANLGLSQAQGVSQMDLSSRETGLNAALQEEQMARSGNQYAQGAAANYTSATRDWANTDKTQQDLIDYNTQLALYLQGKGPMPSGPGGPTVGGPGYSVGGGGGALASPEQKAKDVYQEMYSSGMPTHIIAG